LGEDKNLAIKMLLLYNTGINLYYILISIAALFNKKAKYWIKGRKEQYVTPVNECIWFHFASLGEFEQGRPVLERLRTIYPDTQFIITFFSPSGYEIRKNTVLADYVYYLPLDTAENARHFIETINPKMAIFTKYEYWYHYFNTLNRKRIPLYIISGIFRPNQIFFRKFGNFHRKMLKFVKHFFVQDEASRLLLKSLNINAVTVSGDTRFDRVWENTKMAGKQELIRQFKGEFRVLIAGSTWPKDESLLINLINILTEWKFIFAPHEISKERISKLLKQLPEIGICKYSAIHQLSPLQLKETKILIIDNIGMLSSLYQYGNIAYVGGGFGAGVHNTLEAAAFGLPVIFGPNYQRFKEIKDLIELRAGFSISNTEELQTVSRSLVNHENYKIAGDLALKYVESQRGATEKIVQYLNKT
jgi:3-deoxy-D-manno-octulosonic-acid transferase